VMLRRRAFSGRRITLLERINWHSLLLYNYFRLKTSIYGVGSLHSYLPALLRENRKCSEGMNGHVDKPRLEW